ncbi:MerR family transcriptional regulator [Peteryoungia desertarenae]|uniref:MerR family transcriptional regulator n=1 Tax=Peteryoungia desertarenae TaxID=1813451 RepID=A0ABX6QR87_9HYPH|nr:MerR family transcriptional regulator [Peteryoungia desertarenae]QLF70786.1 MerR family transcriptional regulator [Peteryoungia desertarenae]
MANGSKSLRLTGRSGSRDAETAGILPDIALPRNIPDEPIAIADMADLFGITHRTLHFYEEKGLLTANRIGLMRVYTHHDVARMALINICREVGIPVAVIQDLMEMLKTTDSKAEANMLLEEALLARRRELTADLSNTHRQLQQINTILDHDDAHRQSKVNDVRDRLSLSEEERQILHLMAEGYTSLRIARTCEMKLVEVEAIEERITGKLGAQNRFQAVAKAVLLGLIAT